MGCFVIKVVFCFLICRHHWFLYPVHTKQIFCVWKCHHYLWWLQPRIVNQIFWTQKKNFIGCCSRCGFNKGYDSYHYSWSISLQKQGSTHQSLACSTERVGLFNLSEWGRCWHLYCGKSSTVGNPLYHRCCGWRYWHSGLPYQSLGKLEKWHFLQHWEEAKVNQSE